MTGCERLNRDVGDQLNDQRWAIFCTGIGFERVTVLENPENS